jgi:transposase
MRSTLGWLRGEKRHCSMVAIPTVAEEDARRPGRERESLVAEQTRIVNRIKAVLALFGIASFNPRLRKAAQKLETLRTVDGSAAARECPRGAQARSGSAATAA